MTKQFIHLLSIFYESSPLCRKPNKSLAACPPLNDSPANVSASQLGADYAGILVSD